MHEFTSRLFSALHHILPQPWAAVYLDELAGDFVCEDTFIGGAHVYSRSIPETPAGWCAVFDEERDAFMYYEKADTDMFAYYTLEIPYLLCRQYLPAKDLLTKKDVQKAWRSFSLKHHPDTSKDRTHFDDMQKYFSGAVQCSDEQI